MSHSPPALDSALKAAWRLWCLPAAALSLAVLLAGCTGMGGPADNARQPTLIKEDLVRLGLDAQQAEERPLGTVPATQGPSGGETDLLDTTPESKLYRGSGRFVKQVAKAPPLTRETDGEFVMNFERADIREVVKVVLQDALGANYVVDPEVQGSVTIQTTRPLAEADLLPMLEALLGLNGATLVEQAGTYRVLPLAKASRAAGTPAVGREPLPPGHSLRIVPLSYIGAAEMAKLLEPLAPEGGIVQVDVVRNLLMLAGSSRELAAMLDTIQIFDVDWIQGLSVGFFTLQYANAAEVAAQVQAIIGAGAGGGARAPAAPRAAEGEKGGPADLGDASQGLFRIVPVPAANGLLVVTPQPKYLDKVRTWVERLDELGGGAGDERQLFVYRVKSGEAASLANLLGQLFGGGQPAAVPKAAVAPGKQAVVASTAGSAAPVAGVAAALGTGPGEPQIGIVADTERNSLLITATPRQYRKILAALEKLDIIPLQVLIEATIIEVRLQGDLRYGLQWFFESSGSNWSGTGSLDGTLDSSGGSGFGPIFPGFNFSLISSAEDIQAIFSALAEDSLVEVLSSPSVMVLDNRTARIQVGDQVPIATQQQQNIESVTAPIINTIEYRDTGVVLEVVPRVTPGGLVTLEVDQEVSDVSATSTSTLDSPTFTTRRVTSSIAVQDGEAVVLGGLISGTRGRSNGGVPGLRNLPVVGVLFSQSSTSDDRTELVVVLKPRVVTSSADARRVAQDYRQRMRELEGGF